MRNKIAFSLLFFIGFININFAQTKVSGVVYDDTNQTLPFANIYFKGNKTGVESDENGKFTIESKTDFTAIVVKYSGFKDNEVTLTTNVTTNLKVKMSGLQELKEVVVIGKPKKHLAKKDNPAYRILQGIWKNKRKNGLLLAKRYQYTRYTSVSQGLSNLDSLFLKRVLTKQYDSVIKIAQQDKKQKNFIIPVYLKETNEKIYGDNTIKKERIDVEGERNTGVVQTGFVLDRISNLIQTVNIYDDDIEILNKSFVSPVSSRGYGQYEYVLQDSTIEDNKKFYEILYFPRNSQDLLFEGRFKVDSKTFAITDILLKNNRKMNINFVRSLSIEKSFTQENDSIYLPLRDYYEGDFTLISKDDKEKGLYVKKNILYSDYDFTITKEPSFYDVQVQQTRSKQFEKNDDYWQSLNNREAGLNNTRKIIADLGSNKRIKRVTNAITILTTGYFSVFKNIQFGPFWNAISNNNIEGIRLRGGFRSFKTVNDLFRSKTYVAFGTKDKIFKYGLEAKYLFSHEPRMTIGASVTQDNLQLSGIGMQESELAPNTAATNVLIARGENFSLTRVQKQVINFDVAFSNNFKLGLGVIHNEMRSADPNVFSIGYQLPGDIQSNTVTDFSTSLTMAYTPKRDVYGFGVEQSYGVNLFPTFILKYTKGFNSILGGDFNYNKLQLSVKKPLRISNFGILRMYFESAIVFNRVPLSLLTPVVANQAYSLQSNAFSLIDFYDFTTDKFFAAHFDHHFNGYILNRIPFIKKLKLREVVFYRGVIGDISNENLSINRSSINYNAPNRKVYAEYGFGFENIGIGNFKPIRIDFVWRTKFNNINGLVPPTFGVRFGFFPEF
jgi:Family of unknown function (DUF5686)/CarboxypepD_reg-like domain